MGDNNGGQNSTVIWSLKRLINSIEKLCSTKKDRMLVRSLSVRAYIKIVFKY